MDVAVADPILMQLKYLKYRGADIPGKCLHKLKSEIDILLFQ